MHIIASAPELLAPFNRTDAESQEHRPRINCLGAKNFETMTPRMVQMIT